MDMQNRNHQSCNNNKRKINTPTLDFKMLAPFKRHSKLTFSAGALTCTALGGLLLSSSFQTSSSKEATELVAFVSTQQANADKEKYNISEADLLKQQLHTTRRELEEYKAHLFRSSHPSDQTKIAELGQLIAEKEKLNHQLSTALQTLEKELHSSRKHAATLELTTEALTAMMQTHKAGPSDHIADLTKTFETEKEQLITRINSYENSQSQLVSVLEDKHSSLNTLRKALSEQNQLAEALVHELHDLSNLYTTVLAIHDSSVNHQALTLYNELQANDFYISLLHSHMESEQSHLKKDLEKERDLALHFQEKLSSLKQKVTSQSTELNDLNTAHTNTVLFATLLSNEMEELIQKDGDLEERLATTEKTLHDKIIEYQSLDHKINELTQHTQNHQQDSLELETNLQKAHQEIASLKQELQDTQTAKDEIADELMSMESLLGDIKEQTKMSMVQYSLALQASDGLEEQLNTLHRQLKEKENALEDSEENLSLLQAFIQDLTDDNLALQKENNWLSTRHEDDQELIVQHTEHVESLKHKSIQTDEALTAALAQQDSATKELEEELKSFRIRLTSEEEKNDLLQERLATLAADNDAKTSNYDSFQKQIEEANQKIAELEDSIIAQDVILATSGLEARAHQETLSLLHAKYNAEIEQLKAQEEEYTAEISKLHNNLQALTERHATSGLRNTDLEAQIQSLISDVEEGEYALSQAKLIENQLINKTTELEKRIQALVDSQEENEENENNFIRELNKHQETIANKDNQLNDLQQALTTLKEEKNYLNTQVELNENEAIALHAALANTIDQLTNEKAHLTTSIQAYKNELSSTQHTLSTDISRLNRELDENLAKLDMLTLHIHEITDAKQENEERAGELAKEVQKQSLAIIDKDQIIHSHTQKFAELQEEFHALAQQHKHAYNKLETLEHDLAIAREQNNHIQTYANAREGELTAIQISLNDHIQQLMRELEQTRAKSEITEK